MYNVKLKLLLNKAIAHELRVDEREVLEFVLVNICDDVLVCRRQFRLFSCEISVEISNVCSWSLSKTKQNFNIMIREEPSGPFLELSIPRAIQGFNRERGDP